MEFKDSVDVVIWMLQHIGATLWSIGADRKAYDWKLDRIVACNGAFPFNILFVCSTTRSKERVVFTIGDIGKCLFTCEEELMQSMRRTEEGYITC